MISRKDRTITRQTLAVAVCRASGLSRSEAADLVTQVFGVITATLLSAEPVMLSGFGKFHVVDRAPRRGRNVRAGQELIIGPRKALVFQPAPGLVERLSAAGSDPRDAVRAKEAPPEGFYDGAAGKPTQPSATTQSATAPRAQSSEADAC
jgi:nucleoid DNA-binding protein